MIHEARALMLDSQSLVRATAGGRQRGRTPSWTRVELRPVEIKTGVMLQVVEYDERQAHTRNVSWGKAAKTPSTDCWPSPSATGT